MSSAGRQLGVILNLIARPGLVDLPARACAERGLWGGDCICIKARGPTTVQALLQGCPGAAPLDRWRVAQLCYNPVTKSGLRKYSTMRTTTIRLPDDLRERVARAAERAGMTSHALILDAIAERVDAEERRNEFHDTAEQRYADIVASGETIPWSEMRIYLEDQLAGKKPTRPVPRKLAP
jgi:predicted transcriptional regulator